MLIVTFGSVVRRQGQKVPELGAPTSECSPRFFARADRDDCHRQISGKTRCGSNDQIRRRGRSVVYCAPSSSLRGVAYGSVYRCSRKCSKNHFRTIYHPFLTISAERPPSDSPGKSGVAPFPASAAPIKNGGNGQAPKRSRRSRTIGILSSLTLAKARRTKRSWPAPNMSPGMVSRFSSSASRFDTSVERCLAKGCST